jgi:hypothetical protein
VENKIYHKFRNLNFSFMLEHSDFVCCLCFYFICFAQNAIWKNVLEKKTEKNLEKKRERGKPSLSAWWPSRPLVPFPSSRHGPDQLASAQQPSRAPHFPSLLLHCQPGPAPLSR